VLTEILKHLRVNGPASLAEISRHFKSEVSAMQGMLEMLESKGRIERLDTKCSNCKGCIEVKPEDAAIFQVLEKG
jgi:predicted transcriptional regulator